MRWFSMVWEKGLPFYRSRSRKNNWPSKCAAYSIDLLKRLRLGDRNCVRPNLRRQLRIGTLVTPCRLCPIQSVIRPFEIRLKRKRLVPILDGDCPYAQRYGDRPIYRGEREMADRFPYFFGTSGKPVTGAPIQNNQNLFAAVAANSIVRPNCVPKAR